VSDPQVPVRDLRADAAVDGDAVEAAVLDVLRSGLVILGPQVTAFEAEFGSAVRAPYAVGVASGTDAIQLALRATGVRPGDRVVTVSHTAVATVAAIELAGATSVLVDVDEQTFTMSPASLAAAVDAVTKAHGRPPAAVVVVHLYGQVADMVAIAAICAEHQMILIEDAAQAHGAACGDRPVGSWGAATGYSFYPTKNLAALGDAGAVTTPDGAVADRVARLRQYGWRERFISDEPGLNSRLDEVQAAVLRVRLRRLASDNARRREIAAAYDAALRGDLQRPAVRPGNHHVYHQYVVRTRDREGFRAHLADRGVGSAVHYPQPVHQQPAYRRVDGLVPLAVTEAIAREIVSLPMGPELTDAQVDRVSAALSDWGRGTRGGS
jgi:dTDP-4-amino-4,6-dideoxygalactose transaminase